MPRLTAGERAEVVAGLELLVGAAGDDYGITANRPVFLWLRSDPSGGEFAQLDVAVL